MFPSFSRAASTLLIASLLAACADRQLRFRSTSDDPPDFSKITEPLDSLLRAHVENGRVDYPAIEKDSEKLDRYLDPLAEIDPTTFAEDARLAFWLNTYNAAILRRVLDGEHGDGVFARRSLFKSEAVTVGGEELSPETIEHQIIRKRFEEPLIHVGLVCAAKSCPKLRSEAYRPDRVRDQLEGNLRAFLADDEKNRFDADSRTLYLSPIFDWFEEDFLAELEHQDVPESERSILRYLRPYAPDDWAAAFGGSMPEIEYLDYDWSLNGPAPRSHD